MNRWWSLTPPFHPYRFLGGLLSVALFSRVTPGGRYPPFCSLEPGRSSSVNCRDRLADPSKLNSSQQAQEDKCEVELTQTISAASRPQNLTIEIEAGPIFTLQKPATDESFAILSSPLIGIT